MTDRKVENGGLVIINCGATYDGYIADITRTFAVGEISAEAQKVYATVLVSNRAGCARSGPDVACSEVDHASRKVNADAGYGRYFFHRTGHGLGLEGHAPPYIVAGNEKPLEPGMIFTVEPGIYIEGKLGARIENDVNCTENGIEVLTSFERGLIRL